MADSGPRDRRLQGSAEDPAEPRSRFREAIDRYGYPVALASVAVLYLIWPSGLAPDPKWYAGADDVVFLTLLAFLARQVAKRSPTLLNLPGAIAAAFKRRFGSNR